MNKKSHDLDALVPMRVRVPRHIRLRYMRLAAETPERERDESYFARIALEMYADQQEDALKIQHELSPQDIETYLAELDRRSRARKKQKPVGFALDEKAADTEQEKEQLSDSPRPAQSGILSSLSERKKPSEPEDGKTSPDMSDS